MKTLLGIRVQQIAWIFYSLWFIRPKIPLNVGMSTKVYNPGSTYNQGMDLCALSDLTTPWAIHVVATLRIANRIHDGITDIDQLAAAAGADARSLELVLRHLARKGVFEETSP